MLAGDTPMLLLTNSGTVAPTLLRTGCDEPSSKLARTYSHPRDDSLVKLCAAVATNDPPTDPTGAQLTPVTTAALSWVTPTNPSVTLTETAAKLVSLT